MEKPKASWTEVLKRMAALPYNDQFEKEVNSIRKEYKIPQDTDEAWGWFHSECTRDNRIHISPAPTWLERLLTAMKYESLVPTAMKKVANIFDTEVPLEQAILMLLLEFGLPLGLFPLVLRHVLEPDKDFRQLLLSSPWVTVKWAVDFQTLQAVMGFSVNVITVGPWINRKQWMDIFDTHIQPDLQEVTKLFEKVQGVKKPTRKRGTLESYIEQMRRYSEWYRLSEIEGLGPARVTCPRKWYHLQS